MSKKVVFDPGKCSHLKYPQRNRYRDWLVQAQRNLDLSEIALKERFYETAISLAIEASEKALKGVTYFFGNEPVSIKHSPDKLVALLPNMLLLEDIQSACDGMEDNYFKTRYPDLHNKDYPGIIYKESEAIDWVSKAKKIVYFSSIIINDTEICFKAIVDKFNKKMN